MIKDKARVREITRELKDGFWRIEGCGPDMYSVLVEPTSDKRRRNRKFLKCYRGKQLFHQFAADKGSDAYVKIAEAFDTVADAE